ncbi:AraC family transcriptional regulator [Marinomonas sp. IMCC 4694]|uniref:AraC family transcriptional regulator n=1 Tax=Marinomonas sp. IMCC 4694 TaxID=2605432 RepID=UPI0011E7EEBB|nr:AraC family transcriptional regulator [Marinomonas sp. IMCC 4694]TYL48521.1 AraC family transcriptional regulator [Marinomonas sp. IMCC 4694]
MQIYKIETEENGRELTIHGSHDFPCASYDERFSQFFGNEVSWHWHDEIEIVLVIEGATRVECLDKSDVVQAGEMIFINANTLHKLTNHGTDDCRILNVVFHPHLLGGTQYGRVYKKHVAPIVQNKELLSYKFSDQADKPAWHRSAINEMEKAFQVWQSERTDREFYMNIALMTFWHVFSSHFPSVPFSPTTSKSNEKRVQSLLNFIHCHYEQRLSIAEISEAANISESECFRVFRHALSCTPNQYLLHYRLRKSAQLLTESRKPIADVAHETGFNCAAYFAKKFKLTFGTTPNQFRKKGAEKVGISES